MKTKRNHINEILDKKSRLFPKGARWEATASRLSAIHKLLELIEVLKPDSEIGKIVNQYAELNPKSFVDFDYSDLNDEIYRYIPIALVACLEGYFKLIYVDLIDNYPKFRQNTMQFDMDFQLETILLSEKHSITIGELISHLLPSNNLELINKNLSIILGQDFLTLFKKIRPEMVTQLSLLPVDENERTSASIEAIQNICLLRNRYAHEILPLVQHHDENTIRHGVKAVTEFLWVSEKVIADIPEK